MNIELKTLKIGDIAPTFNLIQEAVTDGHFNQRYAEPRYMVGLALQLFLLLAKRLRLPDKSSYRATALSLKIEGAYGGFLILRHEAATSEIYMCALLKEYRGRGLGQWMVSEAIRRLESDRSVYADCLPASVKMKRLLQRLDFRVAKRAPYFGVQRFFGAAPSGLNTGPQTLAQSAAGRP